MWWTIYDNYKYLYTLQINKQRKETKLRKKTSVSYDVTWFLKKKKLSSYYKEYVLMIKQHTFGIVKMILFNFYTFLII